MQWDGEVLLLNTDSNNIFKRPDLSLIICTLNEGAAIANVVNEICDTLSGIDYEIVVVDDDSTDNTGAEVLRVAEENSRVRLYVRHNEKGLSSAAIKGWDIAQGRILGIMDGDGQHDPHAIRQLADIILKGDKDLVCVSRYLGKSDTGLSFGRDIASRLATKATHLVLKAPLSDPMSGCFMMTRDWYETARPNLTGVGFKILVDLVASTKVKPRFAEVKAALRQRQGGESKLDLRVILDLGALLVEKGTGGLLPARFVLFAAVGMSGVVISALILTIFKLLGYSTVAEFGHAQIVAIGLAMVWNFFLNNILTFRDHRLKGFGPILKGLIVFCLVCTPGAILNWWIGILLKSAQVEFILAGVIPAFLIGILNYWASRVLAWNQKKGS
ncbi:MAG: glycosyltransferase [Asticcacaulis sp.]